ncbi:MAG TPA: hypothetical protein DCF84_03910 [Bacteroidetes bacterium]|nr:hypothetical protein [Bacteroidota bacterium]|tara:strand:- start:445 stop:1626 length:1182 start_codon:yes stop_codon:yes gene_type:complete
MIVAGVLFFLMLYTWIMFPSFMLFAFRKDHHDRVAVPRNEDTLPLTILMFVHNEEDVLENSLSTLTTCPRGQWNAEFVIISDASTDGSHAVVERFQALDKRFTLIQSDQRLGKPGQWYKHQDMLRARKGYLLCLDADVIIQSEGWSILHRLVQQYPEAIVAGRSRSHSNSEEVYFDSESMYLSLETRLKLAEGNVFKSAIGVFGACYILPCKNLPVIPPKLTVDDFFIAYAQLKLGKPSIVSHEVVAHEYVSGKLAVEFRRKRRITCGNWQNLLKLPKLPGRGSFQILWLLWSHKILRWLTPILGIALIVSGCFLDTYLQPYGYFWSLTSIGSIILCMVAHYLGERLFHRSPKLLQGLSYFIIMNMAVLCGTFDFILGRRHGIWKPTERMRNE